METNVLACAGTLSTLIYGLLNYGELGMGSEKVVLY
jgi:hypothetical protein